MSCVTFILFNGIIGSTASAELLWYFERCEDHLSVEVPAHEATVWLWKPEKNFQRPLLWLDFEPLP